MRVVIAGDWHGDTTWVHNTFARIAAQEVTHIIHVGDFGINWPGPAGRKYMFYVNKLCEKYNITMIIVPGNHENYVAIEDMPVNSDGWIVAAERLLIAPRGHRWEMDGRSFVALGGANSIDRYDRIEGISWWKEEQISLGDVYRTAEGGHADVLISHDCPVGVNPLRPGSEDEGWSMKGRLYAQESREMLRHAVDAVKPHVLFHGHYHYFHDTTAVLNDGNEQYVTRVIGMDMNKSKQNYGVFETDNMGFGLIPWK